MRIRPYAAFFAAMLMLSGCSNNNASTVSSTSIKVNSADEVSEDEVFFRKMYADELYNKYNQLLTDRDAFDKVYYVETGQDFDIDALLAAAEKCISTLEAIIAIEPTRSLISYHEQVIEGAEYEIKFFDGLIKLHKYELGELELTAQEIEERQAFLLEYTESETNLFIDSYLAALEAATQ